MKTLKKVLAVVLAMVMVLGLAACGKKEEPKTYQFGLGVANSVSATSATAFHAGSELSRFCSVRSLISFTSLWRWDSRSRSSSEI